MTLRKMLGIIAVAASGVLAMAGYVRHKNATPPAERTYQEWLHQSWNDMARDMNLSRDDSLAIVDIADIRFAYQTYQKELMARDSFPARARSRASLDSADMATTGDLLWDINLLNMRFLDGSGQIQDNPRIDYVINVHHAALNLLAAEKSHGGIGVPPRPGAKAAGDTLSGQYFYHVRQTGLDHLVRAFNKPARALNIPQHVNFYLSSLLMGDAMTQEIKPPPPFDLVIPTIYDVRLGPDFLLKPLPVSQLVIGHEVTHVDILHNPRLRAQFMQYDTKKAMELRCDSIGMVFADDKAVALAGLLDMFYGAHQTASHALRPDTRLAELRHDVLMHHYHQRAWDHDNYPKNTERYIKLRDDYNLTRDGMLNALRIPPDPNKKPWWQPWH